MDSNDASWRSVTISVFLPYDTKYDVDSESPKTPDSAHQWEQRPWSLKNVQTKKVLGVPASHGNVNPGWFGTERLRTAVNGRDSGTWVLNPSGSRGSDNGGQGHIRREFSELLSGGVDVIGLERREFGSTDAESETSILGYVLVHLNLVDQALDDPLRWVRYLHRPKRGQDEAERSEEAACVAAALDAALELANVTRRVAPGGYTVRDGETLAVNDGAQRAEKDLGNLSARTTTAVHAVPEGSLPQPPAEMQDYAGWERIEVWSHLFAGGTHYGSSFIWPDKYRSSENETASWIGHTHVQVNGRGLALVSETCPSRAASDDDNANDKRRADESARLRALTHTRFADLVLLALRQRAFLERHAETLAQVPVNSVNSDVSSLWGEIMVCESQLLWFRNTLWFRDVPMREEGTTVLQLLQKRLGTPDRLRDIVEEQEALVRVVEARAGHARAEREESRRTTETILTTTAVIFAAVSLLFAWWNLALEPDLLSATLAVPVAALIAGVCFWVLRARSGPEDSS